MLRIYTGTKEKTLVFGELEQARSWVARILNCGADAVTAELIAGDASPRKFYRITASPALHAQTRILMVSPATENNERFVLVQDILERGGVRVPRLLRADLGLGFFLLEDLGDITLWTALQHRHSEVLYRGALDTLATLRGLPLAGVELPIYDATELQRELDICPEWFFSKVLGLTLDEAALDTFRAFSECLVAASVSQPQGLVHRDFHSRNLMVLGSNVSPAVIDFQDAIIGPLTYDAVSLLKDVYIVWPRERQLEWLAFYWEALVSLDHLSADSWAEFVRGYDLIGLQRHTKILGVFSRLWLRDHKPSYMADIAVVVGYIEEACDLYAEEFPEVGEFWKWFEAHALPQATQAAWYKSV